MSSSEDPTFFDKERDRLVREITGGFEELLSSSNGLNRKLEEVLGLTKEYQTIASLWGNFHEMMKGPGGSENRATTSGDGDTTPTEERLVGVPGTGGHVLAASQNGQ